MPSEYFTPTDEESIPTREVLATNGGVMDFQKGRIMSEAIAAFGMSQAGLTKEDVTRDVTERTRCKTDVAVSQSKQPYGFDHNYVMKQNPDPTKLNVAGRIDHPASKRRMTVYTNAPGVQLYTSNYLNATRPSPEEAKDGATYRQWQGLCLETQHYPDSILSHKEKEECEEFAKGGCFILRPGGEEYLHRVEYHFDTML
eukprot:1505975-Ditylum_brightwellii.AAC.1